MTLAEELHFGRAAAMLLMAQPVLTHQIQVLEKEFGVQLFIRSTRRVQLTLAGKVFYERAGCSGRISGIAAPPPQTSVALRPEVL